MDIRKLTDILLSPVTAMSLAAAAITLGAFAVFSIKPDIIKPIRVITSVGGCDQRDACRQKRLAEAVSLISAKKLRAAVEILTGLAIEMPKSSVVYSNLAFAQKKMRKYEVAEESLQKAISLEPGQWILYHNLGMLYYEKGELDKSLESFQKALDLAPTNSQVLLSTARVQELAGKFTDARLSYAKALTAGTDAGTQEVIKTRVKRLDVLAFIERGDK